MRLRELLGRFEDSPERRDALRYAADRLDLPRDVQAGLAARSRAETGSISAKVLDAGARLERDALAGVVAHPSLGGILSELGPEHFDDALHRRSCEHLVVGRNGGRGARRASGRAGRASGRRGHRRGDGGAAAPPPARARAQARAGRSRRRPPARSPAGAREGADGVPRARLKAPPSQPARRRTRPPSVSVTACPRTAILEPPGMGSARFGARNPPRVEATMAAAFPR